jgi:hypothetical protein
MKHIFLLGILLLTLTGCQDKAKEQAAHDAAIATKAKAELRAEYEAKEEAKRREAKAKEDSLKQSKLNNMGINMQNGTIIIDTNKTKTFFKHLGNKMELQIKKMSEDFQKGAIHTQEAGINIDKEHIDIDLNKTKTLLEIWSKKLQIFVNEFDNVAKNLEMNTSKGY